MPAQNSMSLHRSATCYTVTMTIRTDQSLNVVDQVTVSRTIQKPQGSVGEADSHVSMTLWQWKNFLAQNGSNMAV